MNIKHYYLMSCLAFAVLQGCSSGFEEKTFTQSAFKIGNFAADGKVALRFPRCDEYRGCKEEAFSANLHWLHKAPIDELSLYDPTGSIKNYLSRTKYPSARPFRRKRNQPCAISPRIRAAYSCGKIARMAVCAAG